MISVADDLLLSYLGGWTHTIRVWDDMLSGRQPIAAVNFAMAAYEGRDFIQELVAKREALVIRRLETALECEAAGINIKNIDEYWNDFLTPAPDYFAQPRMIASASSVYRSSSKTKALTQAAI